MTWVEMTESELVRYLPYVVVEACRPGIYHLYYPALMGAMYAMRGEPQLLPHSLWSTTRLRYGSIHRGAHLCMVQSFDKGYRIGTAYKSTGTVPPKPEPEKFGYRSC